MKWILNMPIYCYKCEKCEVVFETMHSMKDKLEDCKECSSKNTLVRMPPIVSKAKVSSKKKAGDIVKKFIEDTKNDVRKEKKDMRNQEF